jgi:hypothetical protein
LKDKLGAKTKLYIPTNHYSGYNMWVIKAIDLNRGRCIKIAKDLNKISSLLKKYKKGVERNIKEDEETEQNDLKSNNRKYKANNVLIQKYIESPLLYKGRKFDIRLWVLLSHKMDLYVFKEGHLKTCSVPYELGIINTFIHLTNYSIQKYNDNFSKYEEGNEVSFFTFQQYLNMEHSYKGMNIYGNMFDKMCDIIKITMLSVRDKINIFSRQHSFEIFGYDFILDKDMNPYLLEVNTNPGFEESSSLIKEILPRMIDDALRLTVDELYPPVIVNGNKSCFTVDGYSNEDNLWQHVCNIKDKEYDDTNIIVDRLKLIK